MRKDTTHSKSSERREVGVRLNTHGLGRDELDDGGVTRLEVLGGLLQCLPCTSIHLEEELNKERRRREEGREGEYLAEDLSELASDVRGVAVNDGGVPSMDLARVVEDDDLRSE